MTETKPLADLNSMHRKPAKDEFLKTVEDVLKAQRDRMMEFPYLSFPLAFKGTTEQKVGYAWNSLCCSFYCSLVQKDSFPFVDYDMAETTYLDVVHAYMQSRIENV